MIETTLSWVPYKMRGKVVTLEATRLRRQWIANQVRLKAQLLRYKGFIYYWDTI